MVIIAFILNLPWTLLGLVASTLSFPDKISYKSGAIIISVKSFWWYAWLPKMRGVRAMAIGHIVLLGPNILLNDLEHELVHVEQMTREPFIHPFLYWFETIRKGYRHNRYEKEAYSKAGNVYLGKSEKDS